jgi:hypothetical protein
MKSFLLFVVSLISTLTFGQGQFYGTFNLNYTYSTLDIYDAGHNYNEQTSAKIWYPSPSIGLGYVFLNDKKLKSKTLFDVSSFLGKADHKTTYTWYSNFNGELNYQGINLHLKPMFNYQFNQKISGGLGLNLGYVFFRKRKVGTSIKSGHLEGGNWIAYTTPQLITKILI